MFLHFFSCFSILPPPTQSVWDRDEDRAKNATVTVPRGADMVTASPTAPPYGSRRGWVPRSAEDFGDGGAFPEIAVAQYPLDMGRKGHESTSNALAVQLDNQGKVKYEVLAKQGHSKDKVSNF